MKRILFLTLAACFLFAGKSAVRGQQFGVRVDLGVVRSSQIKEASGIAASQKNPGVLWTHNDSGGKNRVFAFDTLGNNLGYYMLAGAQNRDWEDIALGPAAGTDDSYLYVADIGDNSLSRDVKFIYRVREPRVLVGQAHVDTVLYGVERLPFRYPDGIHNAETLMIDPITLDLFIVSKEKYTKVYRAAYPYTFYPSPTLAVDTLELVGSLPFSTAVGGDITPDGSGILIKKKSTIYYWHRSENQTVAEALQATPKVVPYVREPQGEAVCWAPDLSGYYTISEGLYPHLYFYPWLTLGVRAAKKITPTNFQLEPNFPNPFNPETTISYRLAAREKVQLAIFDLSGRLVRILLEQEQNAGRYQIRWDGRDEKGKVVGSGMYVCRLKAGTQVKTGKMLLMR